MLIGRATPRNMTAILCHFADYGIKRISARDCYDRGLQALSLLQFSALVAAKRTAATKAQIKLALLRRHRVLPMTVAFDLEHKEFAVVFQNSLRELFFTRPTAYIFIR